MLILTTAHAEEAPPAAWDAAVGNPTTHPSDNAQWRIDQVYPDRPDRFDAYQSMPWDAEHQRWQPTQHTQDDMPSVRIDDDGKVHLIVGGPIDNVRHNKIAALTYIAPADGTYGITGTAAGRVASPYGLPPTTLLLVKRANNQTETLREWSLNQSERVKLSGIAVELKQGDELALVAAAYQARTKMHVTLDGYRVGTTLAHALPQRLAGPASPVLEPSDNDLLAANQAVIDANEGGIVFPTAGRIRNVKAFGAKGDGVHDDTAAIQAAYNKSGLIYFPNGTYLVSGQIKAPPRRGSAPTRRVVQGQSRDGVVLRLMDQAPGFDNPDKPKALFVTSYGVAQAFRNSIRDMTFEIGAGNPGAVAVDFFSSNSGNLRDVHIKSLDPERAGHAGVRMHGDAGPCFVQRVRVEGFDYGVIAAGGQSLTLEDIHVTGQRVAGFSGRLKTTMHRFVSENTVPAMILSGVYNNILDAKLTGGNDGPAIISKSRNNLLRDITSTGYDHLVEHAGKIAVSEPNADLWTASAPITLGDAEPKTLRLPIKDAPPMPFAPLDEWVNAADFEPTPIPNNKRPNWANALQQAFNDGRSTVYLEPGKQYLASGTVTIPAHVKRFIGMESELRAVRVNGRNDLTLITEGPADAGPLVIERTDAIYGNVAIIHRSPRPLIVRSFNIDNLTLEPGAGDLYLEDCVNAFLTINGQNVWARQHDPEHWLRDKQAGYLQPHVTNRGGNYWVLGYKTEQLQPKVYTLEGGASEVYAYVLSNRLAYPQPMFLVNNGSRLSLSLHENVSRNTPFTTTVRLVKPKGEIIDLLNTDAPKRGLGATFPLLVAE